MSKYPFVFFLLSVDNADYMFEMNSTILATLCPQLADRSVGSVSRIPSVVGSMLPSTGW
jgi:hypothetical protein